MVLPNSDKQDLRKQIVQYTSANLDTDLRNYRAFITSPDQAEKNLLVMLQDGEWDSNVMDVLVFASSHCLDINLRIFGPDRAHPTLIDASGPLRPTVNVWYAHDHYSVLVPIPGNHYLGTFVKKKIPGVIVSFFDQIILSFFYISGDFDNDQSDQFFQQPSSAAGNK
jgi:hypothetical protein